MLQCMHRVLMGLSVVEPGRVSEVKPRCRHGPARGPESLGDSILIADVPAKLGKHRFDMWNQSFDQQAIVS